MQSSRNLDTVVFEDTIITGDMRRALDMMGANFSPLGNYIHAIGYVKIASKSYLPRHAALSKVASLYYIRIGNLRDIIVILSGAGLIQNEKKYFFDHSHLLTASWTVRIPRKNG